MQGEIKGFWGKLEQDEEGNVLAYHPLEDHAADVAASCEALLCCTSIRARLARLGGVKELSEIAIARLSAIAALHDVGKYNHGFQNKAFGGPFTNGHVSEVLALFGNDGYVEAQKLVEALPMEALQVWASDEDALRLLVAAIGHHGRPVALGQGHQPLRWKARRGLDPFQGIAELSKRVRAWFPEAFSSTTEALPATPAFQHAFSGLVMLADWLGSDRRFFPFREPGDAPRIERARESAVEALRVIGLDVREPRAALGQVPPAFESVFPYPPRLAQTRVMDLPIDQAGSASVLEAETGSGKTEAALMRYLRLFHAGLVDGMVFALPTRSAATQIHGRVRAAVEAAFPDPDKRPPVVLAVPGYLMVDDHEAVRLPDFSVLWNDDAHARFRYRGWAAEHPKRYLAGSIAVGTIDQVLLSGLMVGHAHLRATALLRQLLVVDEVHASDAYMTRILENVLAHHLCAGGHAFLMSATLGASARHRLLNLRARTPLPSLAEALGVPYPVLSHKPQGAALEILAIEQPGLPKEVSVRAAPWIDDAGEVCRRALAAAQKGARVLVLRNTVRGAVAMQEALEREAATMGAEACLFRCEGVVSTHHARFAKVDREALDRAIEAAFGKAGSKAGQVIVATQTVQQSLDLDADWLITDLCPMDVLLQRIGRLHRHPTRVRPEGFECAEAVVLAAENRNLAQWIRPNGEAFGAHGMGTVYDDLRVIEATLRCIEAEPRWSIPRDCRALVEKTTHPEALEAISRELGDPWPRHEEHVGGGERADRRVAELNLLDRSVAFGDEACVFPSKELARSIKTRLGEGDRLARFAPPVRGPFGHLVGLLSIPAWLAEGAGEDEAPREISVAPAKICFAFAQRRFVYDRLGLRLEAAVSNPEEDRADA